MSSCRSYQNQEPKETVIYKAPPVYFPSFPKLNYNLIIPMDENFNIVKDENTLITYELIPYWYWVSILSYAQQTETSIKALYNE